ncbi:hypothetical protein M406DRAFT_335450 [Cryphonectria parasitica EP155]|uniref:Filamentation protein n=1 Tax=Cryphonectria parasitica (strain ATCC 38755 / EP155) TaxID=660469 RepID=A0A9P4Y9T9_CRYP1|nr:uncharacterized protein M406DRAFT_335450 [Cryphonectria parasitica EP155]KAF3769597.1 hypothetical protein M406DRAFT_335450 [Cryphonectria parasitica EP155]
MAARGYLDQLDHARCEGNWDAVPELVRKVRKHAPARVCLALTAEVEHGIVKATKSQRPTTARPGTAASGNIPSQDIEVAGQLPKLLGLIDEEQTYAEDRFQAQVCAGWLHWVIGEYELASVRLPEGLEENSVESLENISEWTRVCMLKSAYLRANCLARNNNDVQALGVFEAAVPPLSYTWNSHTAKKELRYWSELFLTEFCMLFNGCRDRGQVSLEEGNSLVCFRSWARWWEGPKGSALVGGFGFKGSVPRRRIWFEYFETLSTILQQDLAYPTAYTTITGENSVRHHLWVELTQAERNFESLLLGETAFPRADEEREEVELFVEMLVQNWAILTGRGWNDQDLGQGGKAAVSATVLELLYRASMKTFHSTAILRNLFIVHLSLAEFDLALKAFDSYLEIVKKGKARVEKTGHQEKSLDADATVLETICLCISALSRFGGREAAEKARALATELEHSIEKLEPPPTNGGMQSVKEEGGRTSATGDRVPGKILALAWQSIGLAQAQWARTTFDASARTEVQRKAIRSLRTSLSSDFGGSADVRGVFALGLLLAEQRELTTAIELVKTALLTKPAEDETLVLHNGPFWKERSLIPLWHLLSLLLSARQEYILAARTCECAFEQFRDPAVLFGRQQLYKSDHLNEVEMDPEALKGLVDEMDDFEKENILEVKMTQLAIVEIMEGPRVAVNASLELLTLFSRLFGSTQPKQQSLAPPKTSAVPRTSGTFRSIRSGIFGNRTSRADTAVPQRPNDAKTEKSESRPQTANTTITRAPTIQVHGSPNEPRSRRKSTSTEKRSESARRNSLRKKETHGARPRASSSGPNPHAATIVDGEPFYTPLGEGQGLQASDIFAYAQGRNPLSRPSSAVNTPGVTRTVSQNSDFSPRVRATEMSGFALEAMEPLGAILPPIQFDKEHEKRRRGATLVKIWLMIAGFYRRAGMYDDSKGAVAEAQKIVQNMEADMGKGSGDTGKKSPGSSSLRDPGWAGNKSIEELWADVWCEMGHLSLAKQDVVSSRLGFEAALTHFPDHPGAIVGLSNILLDLYCEKIVPPKAFPGLDLVGGSDAMPGTDQSTADIISPVPQPADLAKLLPTQPLGLGALKKPKGERIQQAGVPKSPASLHHEGHLPPPYKASSVPLVDRLASRDRAYGLLSNLTKLGSGWNYSEAWFALARAHEESGQADKAKEVLWWCVELEEGMGVREWNCVNAGGYVL